MSKKYKNLLSPFKIGNTVFKNRLIAARSSPGLIQGAETYPTEALISHYANKTKNGMALVTCGGVGMPHFIPGKKRATFTAKTLLPGSFDIYDAYCQRYLSQLTDAIHFYGGKASMQIGGYVPVQFDVSTGIPSEVMFLGAKSETGEEIPIEVLNEVADDFVRQAVVMKAVGFDMVYLHMAYRLTILGRFSIWRKLGKQGAISNNGGRSHQAGLWKRFFDRGQHERIRDVGGNNPGGYHPIRQIVCRTRGFASASDGPH